jgi:hypothetical protein
VPTFVTESPETTLVISIASSIGFPLDNANDRAPQKASPAPVASTISAGNISKYLTFVGVTKRAPLLPRVTMTFFSFF